MCGTDNNTLVSCFFRSSASIQKGLQSSFGPSFWGAACQDRSLVCSPLSASYLRPRWAETQIPPRSRGTGSDSRAPSSVSITLNSRHIAVHRPGTGGRTAGTCRAPPSRHLCPLKDMAGIWATWCSEECEEITHLPCFQRLNWNQFVSFYKKGLQPISKACLSSVTNVGKVSHWVSLFLKPRRYTTWIFMKAWHQRWNLRIVQNEKTHQLSALS